MLLQFRMLSDEDDNFLRDYQIPYDMSLLDFHRFICRDLGYDPENMTSFFASDREWAKLREFTLVDMGISDDPQAPAAMETTRLNEVIHRLHDRLIYQFDMLEDRSLYFELMAAQQEEGPANVMLAHGEAPDQFDPEDSPVNRSIFDEAMSDFDEVDDYSSEEYGEDEEFR